MTNFLAFILLWSLRATAVIVVGCLIQIALRKKSAAAKNIGWRAVLVASAVVPALALFAPTIKVPVEPPVSFSRTVWSTPVLPQDEMGSATIPVRSTPEQENLPPIPTSVILLSIGYGLGCFLVLARWTHGIFRIRRIRRFARPLDDSQNRPIWIADDPSLTIPITYGWFNPVILLPKISEGWPEEWTEAAIAHELAHIKRKDWAYRSFGTLVLATQWFNPAVAFLNGMMTTSAEDAADDAVLAGGLKPSTYAGALLDVASLLGRSAVGAVPMVRAPGIARRLERVVAPNVNRRPAGRLTALATAIALFGVAIVVCGIHFAQGSSGPLSTAWGGLFYPLPADGKATLPNGQPVEIYALRDVRVNHGQTVEGERIWHPDGSKMTVSSKDEEKFLHYLDSDLRPGFRAIGFWIKAPGLKPKDSRFSIKLDGGQSWMTMPVGDDFLLEASIPRSLQYGDVRFYIANESYRSVSACALDSAPLFASARDNSFMLPKTGPKEIPTMRAFTQIMVRMPGNTAGKDFTLKVHLKNGKIELPYGYSEENAPFDGHMTRQFEFDCHKVDIARVELMERPLDSVTFKRIRLYPNEAKPASK